MQRPVSPRDRALPSALPGYSRSHKNPLRGAPEMSTETSTGAAGVSTPRQAHRFTFGLWTVGNPGRDPFGEPTRARLDPADSVHRLAEIGAWGVSLHADDVEPW